MTTHYIDWSKAPEGTTHAYLHVEWEDGLPSDTRGWEKWEGDNVYDYRNNCWVRYSCVSDVAREDRTSSPLHQTLCIPIPVSELAKLEESRVKLFQYLQDGDFLKMALYLKMTLQE